MYDYKYIKVFEKELVKLVLQIGCVYNISATIEVNTITTEWPASVMLNWEHLADSLIFYHVISINGGFSHGR